MIRVLIGSMVAASLMVSASAQDPDRAPKRSAAPTTNREPVSYKPSGAHSTETDKPRQAQPNEDYRPSHAQPNDTRQPRRGTNEPTAQPSDTKQGSGNEWVAPVAVGGAVAGAIVLQHVLRSEMTKISDGGPRMEREFYVNRFEFKAFARGGWPCVVDYDLPPNTSAVFTVRHENGQTHEVRLDPRRIGNWEAKFDLPVSFGDLSVATYGMNVVVGQSPQPQNFRLYAIGCGPKAVGSVTIDRLQFGPKVIKLSVSDLSTYGFRARQTFNKVRAEFMHTTLLPNGLANKRVADENLGRVSAGEEPLSRQRKVSRSWTGDYSLQVRAWERADLGGDWVLAWSHELVRVEK
jgi:hypothetical protein